MVMVGAERLAQVFVEVADTLVDDFDVIEFLNMITLRAAELADVAAVGLLLDDGRGRLQFMAASDERTKLLELFQVQNNEGPCLDAFTTGLPVVNADLGTASDRWPTFAPRAAASGFGSVHALPMRLRTTVIGALNLFGPSTGRLDDADVRILQALADVATIGLLQEKALRQAEVLTEQLQHALNSRIAIEKAKGALARGLGVGVDDAFDVLRTYARSRNLKLAEVAQRVLTEPGTLPGLLPG